LALGRPEMSQEPQVDLRNVAFFMGQVYPSLTEEGKRRVNGLFGEYGISARLLTDEEVRQAASMLVKIVEKFSVQKS
jgi:hypothetical protein